MSHGCDVPVILFLFNRPESLARVVDVLVEVRPRLVLAVADGPRPDRPEDAARCRAARAQVERLDSTSDVIRLYSEVNLGCEARINSGLDEAFREVPEAVVLEDDIVPHPSFFDWCARMLALYRDDPRVMHVAGGNHLGRWTESGSGHALLYRGSIWGFATWRRAWQLPVSTPGTPDEILRAVSTAEVDPLLIENVLMLQEQARQRPSWDTTWEIKKALVGGLSAVPSTNMVANIGFGHDATHTKIENDLRALTPVGCAPPDAERCVRDRRLDRWTLLFELMATYQRPDLAWRLVRSPRLREALRTPDDRRFRHHLTPLLHPRESLAVLAHCAAAGLAGEPLDKLFRTFRRAVEETAETSE